METAEARRAAARLRTALDLHDFGVDLVRQRLRRESPGATEEEIRAALLRWLWDLPPGTAPE
jgi:hypothetical protein